MGDYWERDNLNERRHPSNRLIKACFLPKIDEILKEVIIKKNTSLLDVGSGNGFFSYYFDKICNTTAIDYSKKMIEMNPIKKKEVMDANNLKFKSSSFDIVFCNALLHHVNDMNKVVKEMIRVSKKYVIILEPNRNNPILFLYALLVKEERKSLRFSQSFLKRLVRKNGLKIKSIFSYGLLFPNKIPEFLTGFFSLFNFRQLLGITIFIICEKETNKTVRVRMEDGIK